jgi:hypothetical protein
MKSKIKIDKMLYISKMECKNMNLASKIPFTFSVLSIFTVLTVFIYPSLLGILVFIIITMFLIFSIYYMYNRSKQVCPTERLYENPEYYYPLCEGFTDDTPDDKEDVTEDREDVTEDREDVISQQPTNIIHDPPTVDISDYKYAIEDDKLYDLPPKGSMNEMAIKQSERALKAEFSYLDANKRKLHHINELYQDDMDEGLPWWNK